MPAVTIRKAHHDDYESIESLHQELSDIHIQGAPWNFEQLNPSYNKEFYQEKLENKDTLFYVAEANNQIVAYIIFQINHSEDIPILKKRSWLFIKDIVVAQSQKGKGIGSMLLAKGEAIAKEMNLGSLELSVWSFNNEAIEFYRNKGFESFSIKMRKPLI